MLFRRLRIIVAAMLVAVSLASPVAADPGETYVTEWNRHANNAIFNQTLTPPPGVPPGSPPGAANAAYVGAIHMAMVQGAVYDAVNDIVGGYQPYRDPAGSPPPDASQDAAAVTAAYDVLSAATLRMPPATQEWLATEHAISMDEIEAAAALSGEDFDAGVAVGHAAAAAMIGARAADGRFPAVSFFHPEGTDAGMWRPVIANARDQFAWVGNVVPFMLSSPSQLRTDGPRALTSAEYTAEYNEVKSLGRATGSSRTPAQTAIASFYQPNPVELFNRNFRDLAETHGLAVSEEARLLAMMNLASADAFISCWNDKSFHRFWRPVTAIQNGDTDGNPDTAGEAGWTAFVGNPPYPDHPSGYNCGTSAMMHAAASYFGTDRFAFSIERSVAGLVRQYTRFSDVVKDTIDARVYQGIHFRSADVQGANIGKHVAQVLDKHFLQPVD